MATTPLPRGMIVCLDHYDSFPNVGNTTAEAVIFQSVFDFDDLPEETLKFVANFRWQHNGSHSGLNTMRLRVGGTSRVADGTLVGSVTADTALENPAVAYKRKISGELAKPSGPQYIKLTTQGQAGQGMFLHFYTCLIQGAAGARGGLAVQGPVGMVVYDYTDSQNEFSISSSETLIQQVQFDPAVLRPGSSTMFARAVLDFITAQSNVILRLRFGGTSGSPTTGDILGTFATISGGSAALKSTSIAAAIRPTAPGLLKLTGIRDGGGSGSYQNYTWCLR